MVRAADQVWIEYYDVGDTEMPGMCAIKVIGCALPVPGFQPV